jgi:HEAT repeat protein
VKAESPDYREQTTENRQKDWVVVSELEAPLITEDSWEKAAATLAGKCPSIIPALVQYLDIKDVLVSRTLEETFKKIGKRDVESIHNLVQQKDMESFKKTFLLYVLGDIANPQSQDLFLELLKNKEAKVQTMALRGLYKLKVCPPIKDAKRLAKSENVEVRRCLALALRPCKDKKAVYLLNLLQTDRDFNVRHAAAAELKN